MHIDEGTQGPRPGQPHPAAHLEADIAAMRARGRAAMVALALTGINRVYSCAVASWQSGLVKQAAAGATVPLERLELSDTLTQAGGIGNLLLLVLTSVLFLRWIHGAVRVTRAAGELLGFSPSEAVWGFIIPILSFYRPYQVVRDLHDSLEPERVPAPPLVTVADETTGYREVRYIAPPKPLALPHAYLGAWWAAFIISNVIGSFMARMTIRTPEDILWRNQVSTVSDLTDLVAAALAITVVAGVTGRLVERFRRLRHNPPEVLREAAIDLPEAGARF